MSRVLEKALLMATNAGQRADRVRIGHFPYAVLAISVAVTLVVAFGFRFTAESRDETRFQNARQSTEDRIRSRLDTYVAVLLATRAMFAARDGVVDAPHFRAFVERIELQDRYPGIQGVGFTRTFPAAERSAVEDEMRRSGFDGFRVWPNDAREQLHAIVLLEPLDQRNRAALGYDMFSETVRREAMSRARDSGQPAASGPVTLVQEIDERKQAGFLIYLPVYRGGVVPPTVEERRAALLGFVYSPFRMDDLLHGIFGSEVAPRAAFSVRDRDAPATVLHQSAPPRRDALITDTSELPVAGRTWSLEFWSMPPFERGSMRWLWPYVLGLGLGASGLLFGVSRNQARRAEQLRIHGQVLDSMSEGVSVSDQDGVILYTNPAEDAMFGYERGELIGKPVTVQNTYEPIDNKRIVDEIIAELRVNGVWTGEFDNVKKDGTPFVTSAHITALTIAGRSYWVCVQQDVTAKKRAEKERSELLEREKTLRVGAEAASRTKDEFLAMLGHELRNPLAPIVTALALVERRSDVANDAELAIIGRQVAHLKRLVDDLLDVSAITSGKIRLDKKPVSLAHAVESAVEVVRPLVDERRHALTTDVPRDLVVSGDAARLVQIIGNLLNNAAKYTGPGGHIVVSASREADGAVLRVRDDGQGIPPETLERIFGLFEQGERGVDRAQGGLGIGLAVVRSLVHLHGGSVEGHSAGTGKGSEFVVRLPALAPETLAAEADAPAPRSSLASVATAASATRRVLVVDDNVDAADMLAELARVGGHEVSIAYDGETALDLAEKHPYDVAVLDIGLPGMDGYELAARLRAGRAKGAALVAVTGYGQERDRRRAQEAGFDHHLVKPVDLAQLLEVIASSRRDAES